MGFFHFDCLYLWYIYTFKKSKLIYEKRNQVQFGLPRYVAILW